MKKYVGFEDLPDFLKDYIHDLVGDDAVRFVSVPTPALKGRSILDLVNAEGLVKAAEYLSNVGTKFGMPYGVVVPQNTK